MNLYAYHPADPDQASIYIDKWIKRHGPSTSGLCQVCKTETKVKADKSQKQTHFAHQAKSGAQLWMPIMLHMRG